MRKRRAAPAGPLSLDRAWPVLVLVAIGASHRRSLRRARRDATTTFRPSHHGNAGVTRIEPRATAVCPPARGTGAPWPEWVRTRTGAALDALPRSVPEGERHRVATALVAHWALETDNGAQEWGNAVGNVRRFSDHEGGHCHTLDGLRYRSFLTLADGAHDYVALVSNPHGIYHRVWSALVDGALDPGQYAATLANARYSTHLDARAFAARVADVNRRHAAILRELQTPAQAG